MTEAFRSPYPDYDTLDKWDSPSWDDVTRRTVARRLECVPERRFFEIGEWRTLEAVCDRLIPQPERDRPVPIVPWIDDMLHRNETQGYQYADLPPQREVWREGVNGIDAEARCRHEHPFVELGPEEQDAVLGALQRDDGRADIWQRLPAFRFFGAVLLKAVVTIYYAHPAAWNEIGFGGPASPRGYARLDADRRDPWEAEERHG